MTKTKHLLAQQAGGESRICQVGWTMASVEHEPIWHWGRATSGVLQQSPGMESEGQSPAEADSLLSIFIQKRGQKLRI